jgi:N-acetylglucosamine-6-phosphate deacetylase
MLVIQHATALIPERTIPDCAVIIEDGVINDFGGTAKFSVPPQAQVVDASGLLLTPGWIDLQINGGFGHDFSETPTSIWAVGAELPRFGVTTFLPTIISSPPKVINEAIETIKQGPPKGYRGATPLGLHLEGPFISKGKTGAHQPKHIRKPSLADITAWSTENYVRLVTIAPELPGALELITELVQRDVTVSAGHSMATYKQAEAGFDAGIRYGTHLFFSMVEMDYNEPGLAGALLSDDRIILGILADGLHIHPAMVKLAWKAKGPQRLTLVSDAMAALGMQPGSYRLARQDVTVDASSARLADGSLAGSILSLEAALSNLMSFTGCNMMEAIQTVTSTPANLLKLPLKGRIAKGASGDLTLMTPDFKIAMAIVAGEVAYRKKVR